MKLFCVRKDGGPESRVTGYWLIESKRFFSICALKFEKGSRDAFHNHAFNSVSWLLRGRLIEQHLSGGYHFYRPSLLPIATRTSTFHKVISEGTSWVLSFRGPWLSTWEEWTQAGGYKKLAQGRAVVS